MSLDSLVPLLYLVPDLLSLHLLDKCNFWVDQFLLLCLRLCWQLFGPLLLLISFDLLQTLLTASRIKVLPIVFLVLQKESNVVIFLYLGIFGLVLDIDIISLVTAICWDHTSIEEVVSHYFVVNLYSGFWGWRLCLGCSRSLPLLCWAWIIIRIFVWLLGGATMNRCLEAGLEGLSRRLTL